MNEPILFVAALSPLLVVGILLVGLLWPATRAMPVAWAVALLVGYLVWGMPIRWLAAASVSGVITAVEILWIVFGALVLLYTMMQAGAVDRINAGFVAISGDRRIQVVLLGFFLATFLEGVAGFGTPAAVVAPLLLALGFPPLAAVVAGLVGHAVATMFGAVGTPVVVGIQTSLASVSEGVAGLDMTVEEFTRQATVWAAIYQSAIGVFMPLLTVAMVVAFFGDRRTSIWRNIRDVVPLCMFSGVAFVVPFLAAALLIGPELPSILGAMIGGGVVVLVLRAGWFVPKHEWTFAEQPDRQPPVGGGVKPGPPGTLTGTLPADTHSRRTISIVRAWAPYGILVVLLVITRTIEPIRVALTQSLGPVIPWHNIFGTDISQTLRWAYVPGTWLLVTALLTALLFRLDRSRLRQAWSDAGRKLASPAVALAFVIAMVSVMLNSGLHPGAPASGSMMMALAEGTAGLVGAAYPAVAAAVGVLGTFITGSITVSNITFGAFQFEVAMALSLPPHHVVAAHMVGASVGNALAVHNVIAALATVGLVGQEGRVIRYNLLPVFFFVAAMSGLIWLGAAW